MNEQPKRRWFRFRLSTVLFVTAIAAWGMATQPIISLERSGALPLADGYEWYFVLVFGRSPLGSAQMNQWILYISIPRAIRWPALILFAWLAWKAAWAVVELRRRKVVAE